MDHASSLGAARADTPLLLDQIRTANERVGEIGARLSRFVNRVNGEPPAEPVPAGVGGGESAVRAKPPYRSVLDQLHNQICEIEAVLADIERIG